MTNTMENEIAATLKGMSPQEAKVFLARIKREAIEQVAKEQLQKLELQNKTPLLTGDYKMNKKQKEYFREYDQEVGELPLAFQKLRDGFAEATGWEPGMGDCQLHFSSKPLGSRCWWGANWHTSSGILAPATCYPFEKMKAIEIVLEGQDACCAGPRYSGIRRPDPNIIKKEIVPIIEKYEAGGINFLDDLKKGLTRIRGAYSEFIAPWDIPADSFMVLVRPGWGSRKEIVDAMEKLRSDRLPRR